MYFTYNVGTERFRNTFTRLIYTVVQSTRLVRIHGNKLIVNVTLIVRKSWTWCNCCYIYCQDHAK